MAEAQFLSSVTNATAVDKINSAIFFAEYGQGKTWLGASADEVEEYSPVLIVDIEGSAAGVGRKYPGVKVIKADTFEKLEFIKHELLTAEHPYKTVIFDTLNVAQNRAKTKFKRDFPGNTFAMWDALAEWTLDFVRSMHAAEFMAIFIAHPQVDKDDNTGKVTRTVKLAGSSRNDVPTVPDLIGYLSTETDDDGEPVRVLTVGPSGSVVTKNRFGLVDSIYDPTIAKIQMEILRAKED